MEIPEDAVDHRKKKGGITFVLDNASLEVAKVGKNYALLNCDDHANFIRRNKKDPAQYRPDILHQTLLAVLDSPLNKAGKIKGVYISTAKNVLIWVNPQIRLPRTFRRFCGLFAQLLQKLSIRATNGPDKLLKIIKGPITKHFPAGARRIGFSFSAPNVVPLKQFSAELKDDADVVFVVGAFAHGVIDKSYTDEFMSVSKYPLSAACCVGKITNSLEDKWGVL